MKLLDILKWTLNPIDWLGWAEICIIPINLMISFFVRLHDVAQVQKIDVTSNKSCNINIYWISILIFVCFDHWESSLSSFSWNSRNRKKINKVFVSDFFFIRSF